jgi:hypothetical protein
MAIRAVILQTGYVESGSVGSVMYTPLEGAVFKTPVAAVKSIAKELFAICRQDAADYTVMCCKRRYPKNEKYCSRCDGPSEGEVDEFIEIVADLVGKTANDPEVCELESWTPWSSLTSLLPLKKSEVVEVIWAEQLFGAIVHKDFEERFCKRRREQHAWMNAHPGYEDLPEVSAMTFDEILAKELAERTI